MLAVTALRFYYMNDNEYIRRLVSQGGPLQSEWGQFSDWIQSIKVRYESGELDQKNLVEIRAVFGEAFSESTMQGFAYKKPHGYAGDYEIIDRIYNYYLSPQPHKKWDEYWQAHPAAQAVRNRKTYYQMILDKTAARTETFSVLEIASGPGRSMHEWLNRNSEKNVTFVCIELDKNAIHHSETLNIAHADKIHMVHMNALKFRPEKEHELVWAAGIFDYFSDDTFVSLLSRLLLATKPSGELVIGNFSRNNPSEAYMTLFDWKLNYRNADELINLAVRAGANPLNISVDKEELGVNLFLRIIR